MVRCLHPPGRSVSGRKIVLGEGAALTDSMIQAGVEALFRYSQTLGEADVVRMVYTAMVAVRDEDRAPKIR